MDDDAFSAMPRPGLIWAIFPAPLGVYALDTGNPALPFTRHEIPDWKDMGKIVDSFPCGIQRETDRRRIEEPLVRAFLDAARTAGWYE